MRNHWSLLQEEKKKILNSDPCAHAINKFAECGAHNVHTEEKSCRIYYNLPFQRVEWDHGNNVQKRARMAKRGHHCQVDDWKTSLLHSDTPQHYDQGVETEGRGRVWNSLTMSEIDVSGYVRHVRP